jgi:hypothetical protein
MIQDFISFLLKMVLIISIVRLPKLGDGVALDDGEMGGDRENATRGRECKINIASKCNFFRQIFV